MTLHRPMPICLLTAVKTAIRKRDVRECYLYCDQIVNTARYIAYASRGD